MKLKLNKKRKLIRKLNGQEFTVTPYITVSQKNQIIETLINEFEYSDDNYSSLICNIRANFDVLVMISTTDIEIGEDFSYEDSICAGLIDEIRKTVINYDECYEDLMNVISILKLSKMLPSSGDLSSDLVKFVDSVENMSEESRNNLEAFIKAGIANSVNSKMLESEKGEA